MNPSATQSERTLLQRFPRESVAAFYLVYSLCVLAALPDALPRLLGIDIGMITGLVPCVGFVLLACLLRHLLSAMAFNEQAQFRYVLARILFLFLVLFLDLIVGTLLGFTGLAASL